MTLLLLLYLFNMSVWVVDMCDLHRQAIHWLVNWSILINVANVNVSLIPVIYIYYNIYVLWLHKLEVLTSGSAITYFPLLFWKKTESFGEGANKEENLACQGDVACLCGEQQNWLFDWIPAWVFLSAWVFILQRCRGFFSLSCLHLASWTPCTPTRAAMWPVTPHRLCHHIFVILYLWGIFIASLHF